MTEREREREREGEWGEKEHMRICRSRLMVRAG